MFSQRIAQSSRRLAQAATRSTARNGALRRGYAGEASSTPASSKITTTSPPPTPPPRSNSGGRIALYGLIFTTLGATATWKVMTQAGMGFYSDEDSNARAAAHAEAHGDEAAKQIEATINAHPLVAELRARPEMTESRPHMKMPSSYRQHTLTGGALLGPGKMVVPPFSWTEDGGKSLVGLSYVGAELCGHPGIVHGGFIATMLDEGLARCCFGALPHNIGVTANLNIDYRKPMPANSFLVLRATTTKVDGRKAWVKGHIELLQDEGAEPVIFAEATAMFVSPKHAAVMPKIQ
ncbi:thioesterase superfamily protein [Cordyceps javanica]|uniref:Thioesterase superfamily protein n=1 Tax=Cordyceps javanica TaxID=43265 RepID=A0A545V2N0_9HYPO|nr:thioesterase superfamily protein [Cordyceps javanica]TQW06818.1 thioesterase superfamily protein [Cordyceps javanica]